MSDAPKLFPVRGEALRRYYDATPHPDDIIEAARPREEDARLAATMDTISNAILCTIAAVLGVLFFGLWLTAWAETGEACPGAPDGWLGYCSDLHEAAQ